MEGEKVDSQDNILDDINIATDLENLPNSLRRTVWLVQDECDDETYTADELLEDKPQGIIFDIRHTLYAAYKSGEYKYICKHCQQPLGLKVRTHEGDFFPFFSHFQNSGFCPVKNKIVIDPTHSVRESVNAFKTSVLYQQMIERLKEVLKKSEQFKSIEENKIINKPEIKGYRKPSIYTQLVEKEVCFDLLVSNPLISLLVGRNAFYKLHKMFYIWLFPSFTTKHQRLCQKDILYMNRRNVFVFDCKDFYNQINKNFCGENINPSSHLYAYEESIRQNKLMLNCYWQSPEIKEKNGKSYISIKWNGPKLVAFEDLIFDYENYELYYHNSDEDFYNSYSLDIQRQIDEWLKIKKDRWLKIFDSIEKRKILYVQLMANRERKERLKYYYSLLENNETELDIYYDEKSKLYGYTSDDFDVIPPSYYDAKPFYNGFAWVRKKEKWGVIDIYNRHVANFQYSQLNELGNGLFSAYKNQKFILVNYKGEKQGHIQFDIIEILTSGLFKIGDVKVVGYDRGISWGRFYNYKREKTFWGILNEEGKEILPCKFDSITVTPEKKIEVTIDSRKFFIKENGEEEYVLTEKGKIVLYYSILLKKYGLMDKNKKKLTEPIYDYIGDFNEGLAEVSIRRDITSYHRGLISDNGELKIDCIYTSIIKLFNGFYAANECGEHTLLTLNGECFQERYQGIGKFDENFISVKSNNKWGVINYDGKIIIPFEYEEIVDLSMRGIKVKPYYNSNIAELNLDGNEIYLYRESEKVMIYESRLYEKFGLMSKSLDRITDLIFDSIEDFKAGKAKAKIGYKWGVIDYTGRAIIPFKFSQIDDFINGHANAKIYGKGIIDEQGNEIYQYHTLDDIIIYESTLLKKFGLMSQDKNPITDLLYDCKPNFQNEISIISKDNKWGIINKRGETIIPFEYEEIALSQSNNYIVYQNKKYGIIDITGNLLTPIIYTRIYEKGVGLYCVREGYNDYWGVIDDLNNHLVAAKYDAIGNVENGYISVKRGRWWKKIKIRNINNVHSQQEHQLDLSKLKEEETYDAVSTGIKKFGVFIEIQNIGYGLIPAKHIFQKNRKLNEFKEGMSIKVKLLKKDVDKNRAFFMLAE